jgi:hypothetical protein
VRLSGSLITDVNVFFRTTPARQVVADRTSRKIAADPEGKAAGYNYANMQKRTPTVTHSDDLDAYREVATRLNAIPLGQAPIDVIIEQLAREGKLKHVGILQITLLDVRRRVLGAWWAARFVAAKQTRKELQNRFAVPAHAYRQQLRLLRMALTKFRCEDRRSSGSPLDRLAALGDSAAAELTNDLWMNVRATQRAARRASRVLAEVEREYGGRGRPGAPTFVFAKKLARLWHELSGTLPSVTHSLEITGLGLLSRLLRQPPRP